MKNVTLITGLLLSSTSLTAISEVKYTEKKDDFSNDIVYRASITTTTTQPAIIVMACYPGNKLDVQFGTTGTIFPDDTNKHGMSLSTTHKFDKAEKAITSTWYMSLMKYKNAWYVGDKAEFINAAITSSQLNMRLNRRNDIFKFDLKGAAKHLNKVLSACKKEN